MSIVGLKGALNASGRYKFKVPESAVDHLIVGGGVVGLAIARLLTIRFPEKTTYLVERNESVGEETSSRNSEVIHAGLYYPPNSLKESLCLRGRQLLYEYCEASSVPYRKVGKLVVAHDHQRQYIENLYKKTRQTRWPDPKLRSYTSNSNHRSSEQALPTELISGAEARHLEPDLSPEIKVALYSPETGIIDSHTYMESLERDIVESGSGEVVLSTAVVRVDPYNRSDRAEGASDFNAKEDGWVVQLVTRDAGASLYEGGDAILTRTLINASGLSGNLILNSLLPHDARIPMYYARGSYAAYRGPGVSHVKRLIYPCPDTEKKSRHSFQSLGTHLTLDLEGNIKFGPDIQWISPSGSTSRSSGGPTPGREQVENATADANKGLISYDEGDLDFWKDWLVPNDTQLEAMYEAVKSYLPGVDASTFRPDYVGIRPKLVPPRGGFQDFVFRRDYSQYYLKGAHERTPKPGASGQMITLMGIESPGLTASLAIAEKVVSMIEGSA